MDRIDKITTEKAFKIVCLLDGLMLCEARQELDKVERILMSSHRVYASNEWLKMFQSEFENALLKSP